MRLRFWRCPRPTPPAALARRTPNGRPAGATAPADVVAIDEPDRPTWATAPTRAFPQDRPGCAGRLTRAQEWRANGGRWWRDPESPR